MNLDKFGKMVRSVPRGRRLKRGTDVSDGDLSQKIARKPDSIVGTSRINQYSVLSDGLFLFSGHTRKKLCPGVYVPVSTDSGIGVRSKHLVTDTLIDFPGSMVSKIVREISEFWGKDKRHLYTRMGFLHRRGYLFYGRQGTGKSSTVFQIVENVVNQGNLAIYCDNPGLLVKVLSNIRQIEPDRPILVIFEDIDVLLERDEEIILQYLDGSDQIDMVVNVATTNYPEQLDPRIVARPRRFDQLIEIDELPDEVRSDYLQNKLELFYAPDPVDMAEVHMLTEKTRGLPFASLAELILALKCHNMPLEEILDRLFEMDRQVPRIKNNRIMGFDGVSRRMQGGYGESDPTYGEDHL